MELDQLKQIWSEYDEAIEPQLALNKQLLKEVSVKKVQSFMFEFRLENYLELFINGLASFYLLRMFISYIEHVRFAILIAFVFLMLVLEVAWSIYKLVQADKLSYKRPLIENLKILERLRLFNRWEINSLIVLIPLFGAAFIILIPKILLDLDVLPILGARFWDFMLGSLVVGFVIAALLRLFPDRKMERAIDFLKEISQYESETTN